jgi:hypothetical protein
MAYDDCGIMQFMALEFSAFDQDQTETIALDMPRDSCSPPGGDWKRTFFVLVDPFKKLTETKEGNNFATSTQKCIG